MRVFLAIDINKEIRDKIKNMIKKLKRLGANARWVNPDNIHITIKFFGEINKEQIELIKREIKEGIKGITEFKLEIKGLGVFPERTKNPRVLWAGVIINPEMEKLYNNLNIGFSKIGFPEEHREFKPHLTLCRIKNSSGLSGLKKGISENEDYFFGEVTVKNLILYESRLTPEGPIYSITEDFNLRSV